MCTACMSLRGLFYLEQVVIPDPTMNTPRDMESTNGSEVVSPSFTKNFATQESSKDTKGKQNKTKTNNTIPIGDNEYVRPPSIHEKYAARPDSLEHICLAQFAVWYESVPKNSARGKKKFDLMSSILSFVKNFQLFFKPVSMRKNASIVALFHSTIVQ